VHLPSHADLDAGAHGAEVRVPAWVGGALLLSVTLTLVGSGLRYETIRAFGGGSDALPEHSFTFFSGLHWQFPIFVLTLAVLATLGVLVLTRRPPLLGAVVAGFCSTSLPALAYTTLGLVRHGPVRLGPGYYALWSAIALEAVAAAAAATSVLRRHREAPPRGMGSIAIACALALGLSTIFYAVIFPGQPRALFSPLSARSGAAAVFAFAAVAMFPWIAVRIGASRGFAMTCALAYAAVLAVVSDLLSRFHDSFFAAFGIGFWIDICALMLLIVMAVLLRRERHRVIFGHDPGWDPGVGPQNADQWSISDL
jgi:hypothetical protein